MTGRGLIRTILCFSIALLCSLGAQAAVPSQDSQHDSNSWQPRWVFISASLWSPGEVERVNGIITRAANAGFSGVLLDDAPGIIHTWWAERDADGSRTVHGRLLAMRRHAARMNMTFVISVVRLNQCPMLYHDPNLASGYPIVNMPLQRIGDELVPVSTAGIENGSFENHVDDRFDDWMWQTAPGIGSFADPIERVSGNYSVRFENFAEADARSVIALTQEFDVMPFQQYRLKLWFKAENLTADWLSMQVHALPWEDNGSGARFSNQGLSLPHPDGNGVERAGNYFTSADDLTLDWTEVTVSFNSLNRTTAGFTLYVVGRGGTIWWDDVRIDSSPTLNVIRRDGLPLTVAAADGSAYSEGLDFDPIIDPKLGTVIWKGNYDTHHAPPTITVPADSRIANREVVYFSGYHAMLAPHGLMSCSMSETDVYDMIDTSISEAETAFFPDGYLLNYSEIRTGGWEPDQVANYHSTGEVLAAHIGEVTNRVSTLTGNKPLYVWSDIFDPHHNAIENHYHVNNTLEGSWLGLPMHVGVVNWIGSVPESHGHYRAAARDSLQHFEGRGHEQIIAGYYDEDVVDNYRDWMTAAEGVSNVTGVMYTTWNYSPGGRGIYSDLELFARTWWGGASRNQLGAGGRLSAGEFIRAEPAACRLVFQADGNLVAYANREAYWNAGAQLAAAGGFAVMQHDGNFAVYDSAGVAQWSTGTGGNPGARVFIENDCNVVVRASDGTKLWTLR